MNENNGQYEELFEGQVERLAKCTVIKDVDEFMLAELHFEERLKKDRNYVDKFKISGLTTNNFKKKIFKQLEKVQKKMDTLWQAKYGKQLDRTPDDAMPKMKSMSFVVRVVYPINVYYPRIKQTANYAIEVCAFGTYSNLYSTQNKKYAQYWRENGFEGVNDAFKEVAPSNFVKYIEDGKMGFNQPYLFLETVVPCLVHINNIPHGFTYNTDIEYEPEPVYMKPTELTPEQWDALVSKARSLPEMMKQGNIDLVDKSASLIQELRNSYFSSGFFNNF